ncbi:MAG TPA: hypothetical protein VG406_20410 [Isosphaeraceae bacterium]|jgi:uncharacterized protein (TIGR03067 family)|nr:hypothetical protein [Isosphaeraceae bacterium]
MTGPDASTQVTPDRPRPRFARPSPRWLLLVPAIGLTIGWLREAGRAARVAVAASRRELDEVDAAIRRIDEESKRVDADYNRAIERAWLDFDPPTSEAARQERARLAGSWEIESIQGRVRRSQEPVFWRLTFADDGTVTEEIRHAKPFDQLRTTTHYFRIDPGRSPGSIDMTNGSIGPPYNRGFYRLDGDRLTLAFDRSQRRPDDFGKSPGRRILVFRRVDPKKAAK